MNKIKQIVFLTLLINTSVFAQSNEWKATASKISFKIKNAGLTVDGTLSGLSAKINFDINSISNNIEASIDAKTINTKNSLRDEHLREKDYFDVTKFQKITLKSTQITKEKNGNFKGTFELTIKNKKKLITIPFSFVEVDGNATLKGAFTINRLDFEVGDSSFILSDNVYISIEVKVAKK